MLVLLLSIAGAMAYYGIFNKPSTSANFNIEVDDTVANDLFFPSQRERRKSAVVHMDDAYGSTGIFNDAGKLLVEENPTTRATLGSAMQRASSSHKVVDIDFL